MHTVVTYNIPHQDAFGIYIAAYFYFTGLSAGSFIISTLSYGFGIARYKPLGKTGVVLATLLLIISPLFLLLHVGHPFRVWHLFSYLNITSPIAWGSFLLVLYPINSIIYGYFMFKNNLKLTKIFGLIGIPIAISVHGYTGFILAFGRPRALWHTSLMPFLFLVSAIVSGIALMILVAMVKDRFFSPEKRINMDLMSGLCTMLAGMIILDLFLVFCEVIVLSVGITDAKEVADLILKGSFAPLFLIVENLFGKIVPLIVLSFKRLRKVTLVAIVSAMVVIGIFFMRYVVVLGGEDLPLM